MRTCTDHLFRRFIPFLRIGVFVIINTLSCVHAQSVSVIPAAESPTNQSTATTTQTSQNASETEQQVQDTQLPISHSVLSSSAPQATDSTSTASFPIQVTPEKKSQWDIEKDSVASVLVIGLLILFVSIPFIPYFVLTHLSTTQGEIAFANGTEMLAYFLSLCCLCLGIFTFQSTPSLIFKAFSVLSASFGLVVLVSLFGYQRQLSSNMFTTIFMFTIKVAYFSFTFVFSLIFTVIAFFLLRASYDEAKKRDYVRAGLFLGGAAASWKASNSMIDGFSKYANGESIPEIATAFPSDSFFGLVKQGFQGFGSRYAYQKRWKPSL